MVEPDVNKEYERYAHIVNADEQYMPSWCMYFCSLSDDDGNLQYEGVMNSLSDELSEDNNKEYYRNISKHGKKFEKELVKVSDVLQSCNYPVLRPQDTVSQVSTKDQNQEMIVDDGISVPSKNFYSSTAANEVLVKKIYNSDELELRRFSKAQQVFKEYRCLGFQSSIPTSDYCDISSGRDRNKDDYDSTTSRSKETTNQFTDECTCVAIQETSTSYYDGNQDHSFEDHSNNRPLHLGGVYHPKKSEYFAAPTEYWYLSALDNCFHFEEDETDYELQTSCTYEVIDCPKIVVDPSLVRAESVLTPKKCFVNGQTSSRAVRQLTHGHRCFSFINLLLLSSTTLSCVSGSAFIEVPETQQVPTGAEAIFRCQSPTALYVLWRVNGSLLGRNPPPDFTPGTTRDDNDSLVDTLSITARPQYNGTMVVGVARFDDGRPDEQTEPAMLMVIPEGSHSTDATNPASGFDLAPKSQNITVGATAQFSCQRMDGYVVWQINNQAVNHLPDVQTTSRERFHMLTIINNTLAYNGSEIRCKAFFDDDSRQPEFTSPAILQLQGKLDPVSNVHVTRYPSTLAWNPPFSLDLTDIDPDIVYCVDIYNITCGRRDLIINDCNVTEPSYTSNAPDGYIYEYIVTSRSNVSGARNGMSSQPLQERFSKFSNSVSERNILTSKVQLAFLNLEPNQPVPSSYTLLLESLDRLEDAVLKSTNITTEGDVIVVDMNNGLPLNRVWNCTLLAYDCWQDTLLSSIELSTHDIRNISVSSPHIGTVRVTGDFIEGSTATGVLVIAVNGNAIDVQHHLISRGDNGNGMDGVISGLPGGYYTVSVFVVIKDGLPFQRAATKPRSITVENGSVGDRPSPAIEYQLDQTSDSVCVTCTFLDDSTPDDCLVVVYERISQLSSNGLTNIESSHKFTRSGDTAFGCIDSEINLKEYEVGVIDGYLVEQVQESSVCNGCITGSVLGVVVFIIILSLIPLIVILIHWKILKKERWRDINEVPARMMEEGYTKENIYEETPSKVIEAEHTTEESRPLMSSTLNSDEQAESNDPPVRSRFSHTLSISYPPASPPELIEETKKIVYGELQRSPNLGIPPPPLDNVAQYATVNKFKNPQGLLYECPMVKQPSTTSNQGIPDDITKTTSEYSEIVHPQKCQNVAADIALKLERTKSPFAPPPPQPFTLENLLPLLVPLASIWQSLGEALSLDEDHLDDIFTNNETTKACLQEMLELYMQNYDFQHSWEEMATALNKIGEEIVAEKIQDLHIRPYAVSLPGQPIIVQSQDTEATEETKEMKLLSERSQLDEIHANTDIAVMLADGVVDDVQVEVTAEGNVVEEENKVVEDKHAPIQELITGESSSSSEVICSEDSSEESKSISAEISTSGDEGYISGYKDKSNPVYLSQQCTEAVQPESNDNLQDRVVVHASSKTPMILSKDFIKSSSMKHVVDVDAQDSA